MKPLRNLSRLLGLSIWVDFEKSLPFLVYIGTAHDKTFIWNMLCIEFEVQWHTKDLVIKTREKIGDRYYTVYKKQDKYMKEPITSLTIGFDKKPYIEYFKEKEHR